MRTTLVRWLDDMLSMPGRVAAMGQAARAATAAESDLPARLAERLSLLMGRH